MNWLIWKELRLQGVVLAVGLFLLIAPYLGAICLAYVVDEPGDFWTPSISLSLLGTLLTLSLLGGNAIASERADRSAEFQAYLPIPRWHLVLGKLALPVIMVIILWGANLLACLAAWNEQLNPAGSLAMLGIMVLTGFCACGVAWLVSSFQSSTTFAAASGFVAPIVLFTCISLLAWLLGVRPGKGAVITYIVGALTIGAAGFVGGIRLYLRRIEP